MAGGLYGRAEAVLAVAAALVIAVLGGHVMVLDHRVAALQPLGSSGVQQAALASLVEPKAQRVELRSDRNADLVQAVILPDGRAYLLQAALPALSSSQTYQLWGLVGGYTQVSLGLLGPHPDTTAFRLDPATVSRLAITAEPSGGVATTDQAALVWGDVPIVN